MMPRDLTLTLILLTLANASSADSVSTSSVGIDSAGLTLIDGTPLTGAGVRIGMVEQGRVGDPLRDVGNPMLFNPHVDPELVFFQRFSDPNNPGGIATYDVLGNPMPQDEITDHAAQVASIMISTEPDNAGRITTKGVSPNALLLSIGTEEPTDTQDPNYLLRGHQAYARAHQHLASRNVKAVNLSYLLQPENASTSPNGDSLHTAFLDWSARVYDILYVQGANQIINGNTTPEWASTDFYDGITVAPSTRKVNGFFRSIRDYRG